MPPCGREKSTVATQYSISFNKLAPQGDGEEPLVACGRGGSPGSPPASAASQTWSSPDFCSPAREWCDGSTPEAVRGEDGIINRNNVGLASHVLFVLTSLASFSYSCIKCSFSWLTASTLQIRLAAVSACEEQTQAGERC